MELSEKYSRADVQLLTDKPEYQGFYQIRTLSLRHKLFSGEWGAPITRELFDRHDAVGVLLYDPVIQAVALVEQFRVGVYASQTGAKTQTSPWILEPVAGLIDKDETPANVAEREAVEEAGTVIQQLELIGEYYSSPGGSNEFFTLFIGKADLSDADGVHGLEEEGEDIRLHVIPLDSLWAMLSQRQINCAHTIIAAQWLQLHHLRLQQLWG